VKLKKLWLELGIESCELRLPGCMGTWAMGAAHSKKSRFLVTKEDWMEACLACCKCHETIEAWSHEKMKEIVLDTIAKRGTTIE
jgi:hypothetical protein